MMKKVQMRKMKKTKVSSNTKECMGNTKECMGREIPKKVWEILTEGMRLGATNPLSIERNLCGQFISPPKVIPQIFHSKCDVGFFSSEHELNTLDGRIFLMLSHYCVI